MLPKTRDLLERLNDAGVRYCHWKSNWNLAATLEGDTDLDLLIHRADAGRFRALLRELGFGPAIEAGVPALPAVEHYHALDAATDDIAHVHAYYRVITGESLAKNYHFPVEEMLLTHTRREGLVTLPSAGAELIVFVLRMLVKHTTPIELGLFLRDADAFRREVEWLMTPRARDEALALLPAWLPQIDASLFVAGCDALQRPAPLTRRIALGMRVRARLRTLTRHHPTRARLTEVGKFTTRTSHRLAGTKKKLAPGSGGLVIAFVGPEASGKSTVLSEVQRWLGAHYTVRRVHAGKPPATPATAVPHVLLPLLRGLAPNQRSTRVMAGTAPTTGADAAATDGYPLAFAVRCAMLAYERRAVLARAFARASNGAVVLCDRYPSSTPGAPDGAQLDARPRADDPLRRWLCALERRWYADIPAPDLVLQLTAPLDVTLTRNAARSKTEPEPYVRWRHTLADAVAFDRAPVHKVSTDRDIDQVIADVKQAIWDAL